MANKYNQISTDSNVYFTKARFGEVESSKMVSHPEVLTAFNAGDIVPVYCREVLPDSEFSVDLDEVIRQVTLLTPTMGRMSATFYAFFVPNRIVNDSWKAVEGENLSGSWTANSVSLVPLKEITSGTTQIPVGSVADYYGFPTQKPISNSLLAQCHDLKFRGYVMIYNEFFRDQNYQPPIPMSTLNINQGFLDDPGDSISNAYTVDGSTVPDGSPGAGAVAHALYGSGTVFPLSFTTADRNENFSFRALNKPLKANKLHDYFTSVLPSPQKSNSPVFAPVTGSVNLSPQFVLPTSAEITSSPGVALKFRRTDTGGVINIGSVGINSNGNVDAINTPPTGSLISTVYPSNLQTTAGTLNVDGLALSVDDIRMASAIQQVYETLARGGSRYIEVIRSFFGIEADNPYSDRPTCLCKMTRDLDLFQTAQTSATESGSTPQGNLAGFGYTSTGGHLFTHKFLEHGYIHFFVVVRQKNIYPSYFARDNFRLNMLDFYLPPLANISEQPVYTREINPFASNPNSAFGYQEAWAEYRYDPDMVTGLMRPGVNGSFDIWHYADDFDSALKIADGEWIKSNAEAVLNRSLAVNSSLSPQFKGHFKFTITKTIPMPVSSVPGMDII